MKRKVVLVTGLSGAGMSTALAALEDLGYKAIDNLPLSLVEPLLDQKEGKSKPVAIGIDSRTWDFSADGLIKKLVKLRKRKSTSLDLVFLDCEDGVLHQRFTETRRLHPLAIDRPVKDGVGLERQMMRAARRNADHVIDTSNFKAQDLRRVLTGHFQLAEDRGLFISVVSFGFKNGLPREADLVFDVRFLDNPYWSEKLRPLSGLDRPVAAKIRSDKGYGRFFAGLTGLLSPLLPRYDREGKNYLTVAVGCTGGRHRSVFVAEEVFKWLTREGYHAAVRHRDMDKWAAEHHLPVKKKAGRKK